MDIIETIKGKGGLVANLYQDDCQNNPREWDNLGIIATPPLSRHELRDKDEPYIPDEEWGMDTTEAYLRRERDAAVVLPIFMYKHNGVAISTRSFIGRAQHAEWDSGQVGFIYATRAAILREYSVKGRPVVRISGGLLERVAKVLEDEIKTFNQYIQGDVYGYQIVQETTCDKCGNVEAESLDSCGGFFGIEEARKAAMANEACKKAGLKIEITEKGA